VEKDMKKGMKRRWLWFKKKEIELYREESNDVEGRRGGVGGIRKRRSNQEHTQTHTKGKATSY